MIKLILAILTILILPPAQSPTGCVSSSGVDIAADLAQAASTSRCLHIPAGDYTIPAGALQSNAGSLLIYGDGMGRTILRLPDNQVVGTQTYAIRLTGANQTVRDLSVIGGASPSGAQAVHGISVYAGATGAHIQRVEVSAIYGGNAAGGSGIDLYQPWNTNQGVQGAIVEDSYIHDMPNGTGMIVNSSGNTIRNNRIERTGSTLFQHGIYIQGGYNAFDGNTITNSGGYSLHAWQKVANLDGSGNIYRGNLSVDPGGAHMIVGGLVSNGTNPAIPSGRMLTRNVTITGNTFRNTGSIKRAGITTDVPAIIDGNTFEDVVQDGAAVVQIATGAANSIVRSNAFRAMQPATSNGGAIKIDAAALVEGNSIDTRGLSYAIGPIPVGAVVSSNLIYKSAP